MFDINATDGSVRKKTYESPIPGGGPTTTTRAKTGNSLATNKMTQLHYRLLDLFTNELERQHENRVEQAQDEDFYDNIQYTEEDAATLRDRGQIPLVYNVVSASVDWACGTEKRTRTDFNVLPRRKEQSKPAERKTELMKYLSDVNRTPFDVSRAFEDAVKVGIGWIEDGFQDEDDDEPIFSRYESWRNLLWDSSSNELDIKDARYIFRPKWLDLDVATAMFPKRKNVIEQAAAHDDDFYALDQYGDGPMDEQEQTLEGNGQNRHGDAVSSYRRQRVRLIEAWFKVPMEAERMHGGTFRGELYDPSSPGHQAELESGEAEVRKKTTFRMFVAVFTTAGMLWYGPSPYRHNRFPFTPIWGYKRGRDGLPYGMIRRIKDIQVDVNKRASKALHILSTNKVVMDSDALGDEMTIEEFADEVSRPDAIILKKKGSYLELNADRDIAPAHLDLMSRSIAMIQQASGITDENLGRRTNASSGIAIQRRQEQGSLASAKLFDNLLFANQVRGEKQLALIEQFVSERKAFRITNMRGKPEHIEVNDGLPENDIVRSKADFVISESDFHASMRQTAVDQLLEAMTKLPPQAALVFLDLVVENMDLPNRDELVRRIRTMTKQRDPDQEEPSPEEQQQMQADQEVAALQRQMAMLEMRLKAANAAKAEAQAAEIAAKTVGNNVGAQQKALEAATDVVAIPEVAHIADHILSESGFVAQSDKVVPIGLGQQQQSQQPPQQPGGLMQPTAA